MRRIHLRGPNDPVRLKGIQVACAPQHYDVLAHASVATGIPLKRLVDRALERYIAKDLPPLLKALSETTDPDSSLAEAQ